MPELPEVETIANGLRTGSDLHPGIIGLTISAAKVLWPRTIAEPAPELFEHQIIGQRIMQIGRRAKFLVITLSKDHLIVHLRMSGDLLVEPEQAPVPTHHRVILFLGQELRLSFNDTRKFGRMWLVGDPTRVLGGIGPEPLDQELTPKIFYARLQQKHRQLKPLLLDQKFIAGLGNIYTDEALFLSKLHPRRLANTLSQEEADRLLSSIQEVLKAGIRHHGASIDWVYRGGDFQNFFSVYRQTAQPCRICGTPIQRIIVGQRSTHICPHCQRKEEA